MRGLVTRAEKRPSGVLSGLVSTAAAAEYDRLLKAERSPIGTEEGEFDLGGPAGRELYDAGMLSVGADGAFVRAVPPAVALRLALNRHHRRILEQQNALAQAWSRFARMAFTGHGMGTSNAESKGIRLISEASEVTLLAAGLYRSPNRLLRGTITGGETRSIDEAVLCPPVEAIEAGVEFRMIYDSLHASTSWGMAGIERSAQAGEQSRLRQSVPVRMMHVDDAIALVTMSQNEAVLVQYQPLLTMLAQWFDQLWTDPGTTVVGEPAMEKVSPVRRKVLRLLVAGLTDEAIAHRTDTSVRTVRRHVKAILEDLGVDTRFAAGAAAAKRGWV
jgi:DNA-binding CsgD family transcriptional regulator